MGIKEFTVSYVDRLSILLRKIDVEIVKEIVDAFENTTETNGIIYMIGNGGSAATASHWANDFSIGLKRRGIISIDVRSLVDNASVCTAIANDMGYENIFKTQLEGILRPQDIIVAISCSGTSPNIIKAVKYAKQIGAKVIGLTGFDGGELMDIADIKFHIHTPKGEYGLVEDIHMILDHIIYSYYIDKGWQI